MPLTIPKVGDLYVSVTVIGKKADGDLFWGELSALDNGPNKDPGVVFTNLMRELIGNMEASGMTEVISHSHHYMIIV